jgi:hypothetical protein
MMKLSIAVLLFFFSACHSARKTEGVVGSTEAKVMPNWVNSRPTDDGYYVGIGYASKKSFPSDYLEAARKNALNNLAAEISVNISTESVLSQLESDNLYKEQFQQDIRVTVNEQIEGYDQVEAYETKESYWVYYHLSKADYLERKQKLLKDAVNQGKDFLLKARVYRNDGRFKEAAIAYISGIDKIKNYLDQSLETDVENQKVFLGNELFNGYRSLVNEIVIDSETEVFRVKMGDAGIVKFTVKNGEGKLMLGVPVVAEVKKQMYSYSEVLSDATGSVKVELGKVSRQTQEQYVSVRLNVKQLLKESGASSLVTKLLNMANPSPDIVHIEVQPVYVMVKSVEKNNGRSLLKNRLDMPLREGLAAKGFISVSAVEKADLLIEIVAESVDAGMAQQSEFQFFSSTLNVDVVFKNIKNMTELYHASLHAVKGVQQSFDKASDDAYAKAAKKMKLTVAEDFVKVYSE